MAYWFTNLWANVTYIMLIALALLLGNVGAVNTFAALFDASLQMYVTVLTKSDVINKIPFTINTSEVAGGAELASGIFDLDPYELNGRTSGSYNAKGSVTAEEPFALIMLTRSDGTVVAEDILIYGVKDTLTFNARNIALAEVRAATRNIGATDSEQIEVYQQAERHPRFAELEALYMEAKGWPQDSVGLGKVSDLEVEIAFDILRELKE